ncbi:MAG: lipopolysaccharide biosynthesis protein [Chloroflexota bacterium]
MIEQADKMTDARRMSRPSVTDAAAIRGDLERLSLRGGGITLGAQSVSLLVNLAGMVVLARLLTPDDYGIMGMAALITNFLGLFVSLGLGHAVVQRESLDEAQLSSLFWLSVAVSVVLGLLVAASGPTVAWFFNEKRLVVLMLVLALHFPLVGLAVQQRALLIRRMRFGRIKAIEIVAAVLSLLLAILAAWSGWGYWSLVVMGLVTHLLSMVFYWCVCDWRPSRPRWAAGTGDLVRFGINLSGSQMLNYFARNGDNALIGWAWGPSVLGVYTRAYQLMMAPLQHLNAPLAAVSVPTLSRLVGEPELYRRTYLRIVGKVLLITMPLLGFLAVTADLVIRVLLGPRWGDVVPVFSWLVVAALYQPLANSTGWLWISQDRTGELFRWAIMSVPMTVLAFVIGLPFGAVGVAAAYALLGAVVQVPLALWFVGRRGPVRTMDLVRLLVGYGWLAVATAGSVWCVRSLWTGYGVLAELAVLGTVALAAALLAGWVMPMTRDGLRDAAVVLRKMIKACHQAPKHTPSASACDAGQKGEVPSDSGGDA